MEFKSGFITIVGRPNVGKSTLLNKLIGEKISIVSDKAQTTRNRIQLIYTDENMQCIFIDTPGIQEPRNVLGEYMLKESTSFWDDMDLILYMVDHSPEPGRLEKLILEKLKKTSAPIILVINKIDLISKEELVTLMNRFSKLLDFKAIVPISAEGSDGLDDLKESIYDLLPVGPLYYPDDMITDQTERFIVAEIIREKALTYLSEEVPHGIYVEVERMETKEEKNLVEIDATIYAEKNSHKGIIIGKNGKMLKQIGMSARLDINRLLGMKSHLSLWVKVEKNWRERENKVNYFGYKV